MKASRRLLLLLAACGAAATLVPSAAQAGVLVASASDCDDQTLSQVFLPWVDPASYTPAPGGSFEPGAPSWSLSGGAAGTAGNEPFQVGDAADATSLALPAGSSASSPSICVGIEHPTVRFFARRSGGGLGSALSTLRVDVSFETATGDVVRLPIGVVTGTSSWQPTLPLPVVANLLPLLPGERTAVSFSFTPQGSASWQVDDVYVDPYRRN